MFFKYTLFLKIRSPLGETSRTVFLSASDNTFFLLREVQAETVDLNTMQSFDFRELEQY